MNYKIISIMKTKLLTLFAVGLLSLVLVSCEDNKTDGNDPDSPITTNATNGALPGKFSVSATTQIQFSQGNLQYDSFKETWCFATRQYDMIGWNNANRVNTDLFGWGTGNDPMLSSTGWRDYSTFTDWGVNEISNGGNKANQWRTLTMDEWVYLFCGRTNAKKLFGMGSVNGVNGVILLPDNWAGEEFTDTENYLDYYTDYHDHSTETNNSYYCYYYNGKNFSLHTYTAEQWDTMEKAGAVFLPAAGERYGGSGVRGVGQAGSYWSSTPANGPVGAWFLDFDEDRLRPQVQSGRYSGQSVRLVR